MALLAGYAGAVGIAGAVGNVVVDVVAVDAVDCFEAYCSVVDRPDCMMVVAVHMKTVAAVDVVGNY